MMNIRMLALQAGPNGVREIGKEYDVPEKEAKELINGGYAEPVKAKDVEAVVEPTAEKKADKNKGKKDADAKVESTAESKDEAKG